jgi:hypothetical protein
MQTSKRIAYLFLPVMMTSLPSLRVGNEKLAPIIGATPAESRA